MESGCGGMAAVVNMQEKTGAAPWRRLAGSAGRALGTLALCAVLAQGLLAAEPAHAQSGQEQEPASSNATREETVLPSLTVKGRATGTHEIPVETLKRNMASDMADVFATDPSVIVGGGARNAQRIYVRGIEATNLNVTIDGAKQGGSLHQHRGDIGSIDPSLLKRVEVQTGSSADAGPGALGGSVRFETVDAQDLLDDGRSAGATVTGAYGSVDRSWQGGFSTYGLLDDSLGILAHFSAQDRANYKIGGGDEAINTAGQDLDYFLKLSALELAGHSLRISAERKSDSGLYVWGGTGSDMGVAAEGTDPVYIYNQRDSFVVDYRFDPDNPLIDAKLNVYYNENSVENREADSTYLGRGTGGDLRNTFHFDLGPLANRLTVGLDYVGEDNVSELADSDVTNESSNFGAYLQERMDIGPLSLSLGARLDSYNAEFGSYSIEGSRVSPNIGAELEILSGWTAFANYGEAVRATGILPGSWMANINDATVFALERPETSKRIEAGMRYLAQGLLLDGDVLNLEASVFDARLKNVITADGGMGGVVNRIRNSEPLFTKGWEALLGWNYDIYDTRVSFIHVTTEDEYGEPVTTTRRLAASTGDRLVWDNRLDVLDCLTLGYTLTYVAELEDVPEGESHRPGYTLHGIQAEWRPDFAPGLSLNLAVSNLLDREYSEQTTLSARDGSVVKEPGRDIRIGVTYKF